MRSSSIKSIVVTLTLVAAVSTTTLPAEARTVQAPRNSVTTPGPQEPGDRLSISLKRIASLLRRLGGVISLAEPSIPIPAPVTSTTNAK